MQLKDTVEMMNSEDYKERFKAEYYQLSIRLYNLTSMLWLEISVIARQVQMAKWLKNIHGINKGD